MATTNIVCGSCGAALSRGDDFCQKCGSRLTWAETKELTPRRCEVCGHLNAEGATTCESCGAKVSGSSKQMTEEPKALARKEPRPGIQKERREQSKGGHSRKFEPWQSISFIALLALIGFLIYSEVSRQPPKSLTSATAGAPSQAPATRVIQDLEPFQRAVDANPNDADALLRFANALHDDGAYVRAIEIYKKYLTLRPKNPNARVDLGICYYELSGLDTLNSVGYLMSALGEMQRAHVDSATHQPAVFNLGVVNLRLGNLEESNKWFREAVQLNRSSELGVRAQRMLEQHAFPKQ